MLKMWTGKDMSEAPETQPEPRPQPTAPFHRPSGRVEPGLAIKIEARDVNLWYGDKQALVAYRDETQVQACPHGDVARIVTGGSGGTPLRKSPFGDAPGGCPLRR